MARHYAALSDRLLVVEDGALTERLQGREIECVAAASNRVYIGTFESGLWRSTDGGATFEQSWPDAVPEAVTSIAVSPQNADVVWAGTEPSRVYRSTDAGESWEARPGLQDLPSSDSWSFPPRPYTHHVRWIEPDPHERGRLYLAVEAGALVRTDDGGRTWRDRPSDAPRDPHTLTTHPDAPGRVYVAAGDGYAESDDAGDTWEYHQDGLDHRYAWNVAVSPSDPDLVVVSAARSAHRAHTPEGHNVVYARRDGAWERAMDGLPGPEDVARPELTTGPDGDFYALSNHGLFRSSSDLAWQRIDVTWTDAYREQVPHGLAVV